MIDMHTHLLSDSDEFPDSIGPHELRVMVANGVTTVRFMIGTPELLALRSRSANSEIEAPTIFVASPHLTGANRETTPSLTRLKMRARPCANRKRQVTTSSKSRRSLSRRFTKRQWTKLRNKTYALSVTRTAGSSASNAPGKRNNRSSTWTVTWNYCFVTMHL